MQYRKLTLADFQAFSYHAGEDFCDQVEYIGIPLDFSNELRKKYPQWEAELDKIDKDNISMSNHPIYGDCSNIQSYAQIYEDVFDDGGEDFDRFYTDYAELCVNKSQKRIDAVWEEFKNFGLDIETMNCFLTK